MPTAVPKSFSLKQNLLCPPKTDLISSSPTIPRSCHSKTSNFSLKNIEEKLVQSQNIEVKAQYLLAQNYLNEIIKIRPDLSKILSTIKNIFSNYIEFIQASLEKKLSESHEDFKRLTKRYKKMAMEVMEVQEKLKKKRGDVYRLKNTINCNNAELIVKESNIEELKTKIKELEEKIKNISDEAFCKRPVKLTKLVLEIPKRSEKTEKTEKSEDFLLSSIERESEIESSPQLPGEINLLFQPRMDLSQDINS